MSQAAATITAGHTFAFLKVTAYSLLLSPGASGSTSTTGSLRFTGDLDMARCLLIVTRLTLIIGLLNHATTLVKLGKRNHAVKSQREADTGRGKICSA